MTYFSIQNKTELQLLKLFGKKLKKGSSTRCTKHLQYWSELYRNLANYNCRGTTEYSKGDAE